MAELSDERLLRWLDDQMERGARFAAGHPLLVDAAVAAAVAAISVGGLLTQLRLSPAMTAFCAALCLPLMLGHRAPRAGYACVSAVALVQWLVSGPQLADAAVLVALYRVALACGAASIAAALAVAEVGAAMLALRWETAEEFKYWVGVSGLTVAAAALGLMIRQRSELLESLREKAARLERERDQQAALGAAAERARIAREMHDIVSHNLTVMIGLADGARYALEASPERAVGAIEGVAETGRQALVEMRRLLGVLRGDEADASRQPQPTLAQLDELVARVRAAGVPVEVVIEGDPRALAPGVQLTLFRVAQEALTNTLKHASRPVSAQLAMRCCGDRVELEVTDTGGPARGTTGGGRGLLGMRERANAYDGELEAGPTADGGWRVLLRLGAPRGGRAAYPASATPAPLEAL